MLAYEDEEPSEEQEAHPHSRPSISIDGISASVTQLRQALDRWPARRAEGQSPFDLALYHHLEVMKVERINEDYDLILIFSIFATDILVVPRLKASTVLPDGSTRADAVGYSLVSAKCLSRSSLLSSLM